jgi:hypothetical protein
VLFWVLREQSYTGDWKNWTRFIEDGLWYRLREPICLLIYQVPYIALRPFGATGTDVLAGTSCVLGGFSMAYGLAILRLLTPERHLKIFGMAVLTASYGVSGIFFGHVEHYSVMSLGCFAYLYYALRYLRGSSSVAAPGLVLGLLLTTHLMAAWLVPSLMLLPYVRSRAGTKLEGGHRDLVRALLVMGLPNLVTWFAILAVYYDGSILALIQDGQTGSYSRQRYGGPGNALGGGNTKLFLEPFEILSLEHLHGMLALFIFYSPFTLLALPACCAHRGRERFRALLRPDGLALLSLLLPYTVYAFTWEPGRGYVEDWDLFSHTSIFLVFTVLVLVIARPWSRAFGAVVLSGLLLSAVGTGYTVVESLREGPSGVHSVITSMGVSAEKLSSKRRAP